MIKDISKRLLELGIEVDENSSAMIAYWDENLICRYANHAYTDWFGVHPELMVNQMSIKELLGPLYIKNKPFIDGALHGEVQIFNRNIISPFGETRPSIATYCPVIEGTQTRGFYVHVEDVTIRNNTKIVYGIMGPKGDVMANVKVALEECLLTEFPGISKLAKQHLLSESKLKKDFKARYNQSIFSFYRHLQMELADVYITEKKFTKKQVASLLNFTNSTNFIICYQKHLKERAKQKVIEEITKSNDNRYKTFITQAPFAIAMFDNNMVFKAASQKFIDDYHLNDKKVNGACYYDLFPLLDKKWKKIHHSALNGTALKGEDRLFDFAKGASWIRWDIRPWRNLDGSIGGILIYTEDVTSIKLKDEENSKIIEILNKASEVVKIGTWKKNFKNNTGFWSDITKKILEVPDDFQLTSDFAIEFYKIGKSRNMMQKLLRQAVDYGKSFDVISTIITAKGNEKTVRVIGYPEFINGKCERLFGIFQEIDSHSSASKK